MVQRGASKVKGPLNEKTKNHSDTCRSGFWFSVVHSSLPENYITVGSSLISLVTTGLQPEASRPRIALVNDVSSLKNCA